VKAGGERGEGCLIRDLFSQDEDIVTAPRTIGNSPMAARLGARRGVRAVDARRSTKARIAARPARGYRASEAGA
jgi:hypothetical protein